MSTLDLLEKIATEKGLKKGIERGIEQGIEKGIEQGIELGKADVIKNLLANTDFTTKQIASLTGVNEEMVIDLRKKTDSGK